MVGLQWPAQGTFLRTNYRHSGGVLGPVDIGGGFFKGSAYAGSGAENQWWCGYVFYSVALDGSQVNSGLCAISAPQIMSGYFGEHRALAGYKIVPFGIWPRYISGSLQKMVGNVWWSVSDSLVVIHLGRSTVSCLGSCTSTLKLQFAGFIASTP